MILLITFATLFLSACIGTGIYPRIKPDPDNLAGVTKKKPNKN